MIFYFFQLPDVVSTSCFCFLLMASTILFERETLKRNTRFNVYRYKTEAFKDEGNGRLCYLLGPWFRNKDAALQQVRSMMNATGSDLGFMVMKASVATSEYEKQSRNKFCGALSYKAIYF